MPSETATPPSAFDAQGRIIPRTAEEQRRHAENALRMLDSLLEMGDEQEQRETFEALRRGIDENRLSDRKRFHE